MQVYLITKSGYEEMEAELKQLKQIERPAIIKAIAEAREHGDLKENAEYHSAKDKQGFIEGRIIDLEGKFSRASVVEPHTIKDDKIRFGATIKILDEGAEIETIYKIVSEYEADVRQGRVSVSSPLARQLLGKEVDDSVEITTPRGTKFYTVLEIKYK
jgi:transcription elongation factor GreA